MKQTDEFWIKFVFLNYKKNLFFKLLLNLVQIIPL